jgi:two-component system phosphate regulon sensor histidine kinase PhoR
VSFWAGPLSRILLLVVAALVVGGWFGLAYGCALLAAGFAVSHAYHLIQLARLHHWLGAGAGDSSGDIVPAVPDAFGAWGENFAILFRLRRAERAGRERLTASLERLSQAAEALPDGIVLLDEQLRIEWCNPAASRHLGIESDRDRGTPIVHLVREPEFADYVVDGGAPIILRPVSGLVRIMSLALIPFSDNGRLLISRDITAIERADTVRRDFIANVSHELRTPLTVIVGFLESMVTEADEGSSAAALSHHRQLAMMFDQAQRMQRLVDDLLALSRLDEGQPPAREDTIDVPGLLAAVVEEGRALSAGRHSITLDCAAHEGLRGSREELRSAFANLLSNAIRYTPAGGTIQLSWSLRQGLPVLAVIDNGIGISPEHIPRLTERFYRVDRGRSSAGGGTGLGLAIVKHVLLRHGARLEIASTSGRGSTFSAVFPRDRILPALDQAA